MSKKQSYIDCHGWIHEYYTLPSGACEYTCKKGGLAITNIKNFVVVKCAPRSIADKIDWLLNEVAESNYNNADISVNCDVYTGEYIRIDICTDNGEYSVFNNNNMLLFADVLADETVKKLGQLMV